MNARPTDNPSIVWHRRWLPSRQQVPLLATVLVCLLLYFAAGLAYAGFFSREVAVNFLADNAFLGIAALGLTPVILLGGIDLSVGSMVGCAGIVIATLVEQHHVHPATAAALALLGGTAFGCAMGWLIHRFELAPFLVTLGGLFVLRGLALLVSTESVAIVHPLVSRLAQAAVPLPGLGVSLPITAMVFLSVALLLVLVSLYTPFGRNIYAVGGSEPSAMLMGLPVGATKVAAYALSGFCAALAGVVYTLYTQSGNATAATGMELDAIAAVVVGGTLLSGGVGYVAGTPIGVLVFGIIQTAITFQGTLSSWWTKIVIGGLLLAFIVLQKLVQPSRAR